LFDNHPDDVGHETQPTPQRRPWIPIAVAAAALAVIGSGSAVLWHVYGGGFPALPSFASGTEPAGAPAVAADKPVGLKDLQAFQQQIAGPIQSTAQLLAAQQAEIKRLADQVAVLSAKVELLERPAAAQAAMPAAQSAAPQPASPAPRKRPAAPKPPDGISVGGAPLPPPR
jgi:uncharacterized coiled-coil protein SlyX